MWDGNETWLVLGGMILYACFPKAYSIILPVLYSPLMLMLCALVGRGVAFEFKAKATRHKYAWARLFFISSLLATFSQGVLLQVQLYNLAVSKLIYLHMRAKCGYHHLSYFVV